MDEQNDSLIFRHAVEDWVKYNDGATTPNGSIGERHKRMHWGAGTRKIHHDEKGVRRGEVM